MGDIQDFNNPSFVALPYASNRTGYQNYCLPMILVVPHIRNSNGAHLPNSEVFTQGSNALTIYVLEEPDKETPVAGWDHRGIFDPDYSLYYIKVAPADLFARKITPTPGSSTTFAFTSRTGVIGTLTYLENADYYDLSDIKIPVDQLPVGHYTLVYQVGYYPRTVSDTGLLVCFDTTQVAYAVNRSPFSHPGDILLQMVKSIPDLYITGATLSTDTTVQFLRPFAELIQDLHDEQGLLEDVNWVYNVRPEYVPYLGFLLGWDLPYFPDSIDNLRLATLRNIVRLQKLKGTKRAVREMFDLFGFLATIHNIWWTPSGTQYIAPGENASFPVTLTQTATYEPLLLDYQTNGYAAVTVPLINRPSVQRMSVETFLVTKGTEAEQELSQIKANLEIDTDIYNDNNSLLIKDRAWINVGPTTPGIVGYARFDIDTNGAATLADNSGWPAYTTSTVRMDYNANVLTISCSRYLQFDTDDTTLYVFASYVFDKLDVPISMENLQSNRFDIEITPKDGSQIRADVLDFLIDFLYQIKAFHSLLRKIIFAVNLTDVYLVTDLCVGGLVTQDPSRPFGRIQVPPDTIIPNIGTNICNQLDPTNLGYRPQDIAYRQSIITGINEEFAAWQALGAGCVYNYKGQDRITEQSDIVTGAANGAIIQSDSPTTTLCTPNGSDYCFKGRVQDVSSIGDDLLSTETWTFKTCRLTVGNGSYFTAPFDTKITNDTLRYVGPGTIRQLGGHNVAVQRPSLEIAKYNLSFPGCRLARMGNLQNDFTSTIYDFRPWDFAPIACPPSINNFLNAYIAVDSEGHEHLVYDQVPYKVSGNGIIADINSLGEHRPPTDPRGITQNPNVVVQSIYLAQSESAYVTLEGTASDPGIINVNNLLFSSGTACGGLKDYAQGYPAITGWLTLPSNDIGTGSGTEGIYSPTQYFPSLTDPSQAEDLKESLGIPNSQAIPDLLFTTSSQITVSISDIEYDDYLGYRFDCGCLRVSCNGTGETGQESSVLNCTVAQFLNVYGELEPDQIDIIPIPSLIQTIRGSNLYIDHAGTLFNILQTNEKVDPSGTIGETAFPPSGSFSYKDSYDIIYDISWETISKPNVPVSYVDFITVKKDPRIPGISDHNGLVKGKQVYYNGLVTTTRQLYSMDATVTTLIAIGEEQEITEYQDSFLCGTAFINPFANDLNHNLVDETSAVVNQGSHWGDPTVESNIDDCSWGNTYISSGGFNDGFDGGFGGGEVDVGTGIIPGFTWIDVFGA